MSKQGKTKEWIDISNEKWREYLVPAGGGAMTMRIFDPISLAITADGHEIKDKKGAIHEIPRGWLKITYMDKKFAEDDLDEELGEDQPQSEE